jgi:hypothetical protein
VGSQKVDNVTGLHSISIPNLSPRYIPDILNRRFANLGSQSDHAGTESTANA